MEKILWAGIAVLWVSLIGGSALGADGDSVSGESKHPLMSDRSGGAIMTPVASISAERVLRPVVEPGSHGGSELAGAFLVGVACVARTARRRGLI